MNFKKKTLHNPDKKQRKKDIVKNVYVLFNNRERVLDAFESKIFPIKVEGTGFSGLSMQDKVSSLSNLKTLTPKQMLQRSQITLTHVKTDNTSQNILNKIRQIILSWNQAKLINTKVYNNIMN